MQSNWRRINLLRLNAIVSRTHYTNYSKHHISFFFLLYQPLAIRVHKLNYSHFILFHFYMHTIFKMVHNFIIFFFFVLQKKSTLFLQFITSLCSLRILKEWKKRNNKKEEELNWNQLLFCLLWCFLFWSASPIWFFFHFISFRSVPFS